MDLSATQIYEDENFPLTQEISHALEKEKLVQVGTLSIDSKDYQIKTGTTKIGRLGNCDIVINDATVSKLHAEIEASGGQGSAWISDLNSSNKTKLNNLILRPTRLYELKDGSVIEFGRVRATYHIYCPANDIVIPETPVPSRQKVASAIIPNTPDSSFNNSSSADDDGLIRGTQKDCVGSVFRRPQIPQHQSASISKKSIPSNESNDSKITISHTSNINISENQVSIFDAETQKFEEGSKMASRFMHDTETQKVSIDISEHSEANAKIGKQLPELNIHNKATSSSVTDIHNIETQSIDDINEIETQKNINIQDVTRKKFITDIHIKKTQDYTIKNGENSSNVEKPEISKNNNRDKNLAQIGRDIHDLETQKFDNITKDISDLETQFELGDTVRCEQNRNVSDMETQFMTNNTANETSNNRAKKNSDKDSTLDTAKDGINHENITKSPRSRSSSPGSLNLSSPGVEDCPSPLNQSGHLLESSYLLEFFGEDIDKQEKMQACNVSTPLTKMSSERNSNVANAVNIEENNDEDIFEAPTQRVNRKLETVISNNSETNEKNVLVCKVSKKKREKLQSEQTNDDSETDAEEYISELAKKRESLETLNKLFNENISNRDDPGTSIESEDMFDVLTQRLDNPTTKNTSDSSINQPQRINELNRSVDDIGSTQIVNNVDQDNQTNMPDINNVELIQCILSRETSPKTVINSKDILMKTNQNDLATMHIINTKSIDCTTETLDCENIDYELAPTQVIDEIEDKKKRNSNHERDSSQVNLTDGLEQKLSEMFDNVNNDTNNIHESQHMSTQYLENILESSQCDDLTNKSIAGNRDTDSVPRKQLRKRKHVSNQHLHNSLDIEINANNMNKTETDSKNSDVYVSTTTTRQRRNILRDTQEFVEDTTPRQNVNSSRASKANNEKAMDDNTIMEFTERRKRNLKTKSKSDAITEILNDDNKNKTILSKNNEKSLRSSKSTKQKDVAASETNKQILEKDPTTFEVNDAEENTSICIPCSSKDEQRIQTLYESDDDILTRLPAIRISGTLSNPASPSASSTSTVRSTRYKRNIAKGKRKKHTSSGEKSLRERNVGNLEENDKPPINSHLNSDISTTVKMSGPVDTSEDSETDNETKYKRFQQMADRMLGNKLNCLKRKDKESRKNVRVSPDVSEDSKQSMDVKSKNPARTNSRMTRNSSRQSDESSHDFQRKIRVKNTAYENKSTDLETKSAVAKKKIFPTTVEESVKQITSKKHKTTQVIEECPISTRSRRNIVKIATDRQSPNILEYSLTKRNSRGSSPIIENTKFSKDNKTVSKTVIEKTQEILLNTGTNGDLGRFNEANPIKRTKRTIYNRQVSTQISDVTANGNSEKNKTAQIKETEMQVSQSQNKVLKILLSPIKSPTDDGSQEIERIMAKGPSNVHDKNLSVRESSKAKIFQRELRTKRKRSNSDTETDSVLTESGMSEAGDSDNTQVDKFVLRTKRGRFAKSSVLSLPEAHISKKKETFKKPTRVKNSTSLILDSSVENTISENSQNSIESDISTNSRVSRSRAASIKKKNMELNQNTHILINESVSRLNTSIEITSLSTPSRTRRSTSILNNSTSSAMKHKVLFTGITEDYSKIIKTLGGTKVEDPAKCTVLVTDKVRRTYKFLCALAKGIPIVAIDWLRDSEATARFLDWENYILKDPAAEAKFGFRLRKSLDKAKEKKLLDGYIVVLTPGIAPPPIEELKDMITSCGGKALLRPPTKWPEKAVILSREEDLPNARKFLAKAPKTVTIQSTEFILTGILRQETDFAKYKLT